MSVVVFDHSCNCDCSCGVSVVSCSCLSFIEAIGLICKEDIVLSRERVGEDIAQTKIGGIDSAFYNDGRFVV